MKALRRKENRLSGGKAVDPLPMMDHESEYRKGSGLPPNSLEDLCQAS